MDELSEAPWCRNGERVAKKTISDHLESLEQKRYIKRFSNGARAIKLIGYTIKVTQDEPDQGVCDGPFEFNVGMRIIIKDFTPGRDAPDCSDRNNPRFCDPGDCPEINYEIYFVTFDRDGKEKLLQIPDELYRDKEFSDMADETAYEIADAWRSNMESDRIIDKYEREEDR